MRREPFGWWKDIFSKTEMVAKLEEAPYWPLAIQTFSRTFPMFFAVGLTTLCDSYGSPRRTNWK